MTSRADLDELLTNLKEESFAPGEAVILANELAEAVVGFIADRAGGHDPPADVLDDVVDAAEFAQKGYDEAATAFQKGSPERETLKELSAYWEMRAAAARYEAGVMRSRTMMAAEVATPATPASPLHASSSSKTAAPTTSVDVAEVTSEWDPGVTERDRRPEARAGDVLTRQAGGDAIGIGEQYKQDLKKIARGRGGLRVDEVSTASKGTDPTALGLELSKTPRRQES